MTNPWVRKLRAVGKLLSEAGTDGALVCYEAANEMERLQKQIDECGQQCSAGMQAMQAEITRLRAAHEPTQAQSIWKSCEHCGQPAEAHAYGEGMLCPVGGKVYVPKQSENRGEGNV